MPSGAHCSYDGTSATKQNRNGLLCAGDRCITDQSHGYLHCNKYAAAFFLCDGVFLMHRCAAAISKHGIRQINHLFFRIHFSVCRDNARQDIPHDTDLRPLTPFPVYSGATSSSCGRNGF